MRTITTEDDREGEVHLLEADIDNRRELINRVAAEVDAEFVSATAWLEQELRWMKAAKLPFIINETTMDGRRLLEVETFGGCVNRTDGSPAHADIRDPGTS